MHLQGPHSFSKTSKSVSDKISVQYCLLRRLQIPIGREKDAERNREIEREKQREKEAKTEGEEKERQKVRERKR